MRANSVGPGMLTDGMAQRLRASGDLDDGALDAARANIPLRSFGSAADIAEAVCFLASDRAGYISGQHLLSMAVTRPECGFAVTLHSGRE